MKQIAFYCHALGIGDILSAGPALKKVIKSYPDDTEFNIFTYHSYIFKHHPILNSFAYEEFSDIGYDEVFELFARVEGMVQNKYDSHIKHNQFDIRQVTAAEFGFTLLPEEMTCKYFPGKFDETKFKLPEKYIVMHCAQTWPSRTWPVERWQKLISRIEGEKNIPVVLVGRRIETDESTDPTKVPFDLDLSLGVDLVSKTTFDESWHIINNSIGVITNDSGILHIAGTTDVEIFYIGGSINPKLRMPYRKGTQEYKINFIGGECDIFCASDPKYSILEHGHFHSIPPLIHCLESYEKHGIKDPKVFECHPSTDRVFDIVKKFIPDSLPDLLELRYKEHSTYPKDIDEHLPILKKYALECDHITEMGVRCIVSTWALLMGKPKRLVSVDILHPLVNAKNIKCDIPHHTHSINEVEEVSKNIGCDFEFILENTCNPSFEIEETDLLFIDTLHCYEQLTRELELHADKVRKYIIFHDTEKFARNNSENWGNPKAVNPFLQEGTFISDKGLKNVVEEFLEEHKEWRIKKHYTNNNGLTILEKRNDKIVVVSTHFDHTNDKRLFTQTWMTVECIENFNNLGFEVIVASHSQIPKEVSDICKGTVVDEYNPSLRISREPDGSQCWWGDTDLFKVQHLNSNLGKNWSYGSYMNYYNGAEEAKKMGYERCLFTNYDIRIDDKFVEDLERFSYWYDGVVYNFNDVLNRENSKTYMYSGILYLDLEYYFKIYYKIQFRLNE